MIKSISFIVLTQLFQFNQLKILRQPGYLIFVTFFTVYFAKMQKRCTKKLTL